MKQIRQTQKELEQLQHQLVGMLAKFALVSIGFIFLICWFTQIKSLLGFSSVALLILAIGLYLFKRWYVRYMVLRTHFFTLDEEYKKCTSEHLKEVQQAMNGLLYIRRF